VNPPEREIGSDEGPRRVTALKPQKGPWERLNVFVDGEFAFGIDAWGAAPAGRRVGEVLTEERQRGLLAGEEAAAARTRGLRFLETRDRSGGEVAARLRRHGYDEEVVSAAIVWLEERGFVDDRRFASSYAAEKRRAGWGRRRVESELLRRGIDRSILDETLDSEGRQGEDASAENDLIAVVARRFGAEAGVDRGRAERRARAFLLRRGHDWGAVGRIVHAAFDGEAGDDAGFD
jgi:regulatory protein